MQNNNDNRQQQGGSGSAEHTDCSRDEQKLANTNLGDEERSDIAAQIGEEKDSITTISDLGGLSGRDDAAGGSGDRMEGQNTADGTEKF